MHNIQPGMATKIPLRRRGILPVLSFFYAIVAVVTTTSFAEKGIEAPDALTAVTLKNQPFPLFPVYATVKVHVIARKHRTGGARQLEVVRRIPRNGGRMRRIGDNARRTDRHGKRFLAEETGLPFPNFCERLCERNICFSAAGDSFSILHSAHLRDALSNISGRAADHRHGTGALFLSRLSRPLWNPGWRRCPRRCS